MKIYLIRHGETDWNLQGKLQGREDIALNENGKLQAAKLGNAFKGKGIKAIFTSPLIRAKKTAEIIAEIIDVKEVSVEEELIERDFGKLSGLTYDKRKYFDTFGRDEGIEPWQPLADRITGCMKSYAVAYPNEDIIMVSHGAAINAAVSVLSDGELGSGKTRLNNACINIITYEDGVLRLDKYNLTADELIDNVAAAEQ